MSLVFAMRGNKSKQYQVGYSSGPLEVRGTWHVQGRQPVDDGGGVPKWIDELFNQMPDLETVALGRKDRGVVFSRIKEEKTNEPADEIRDGAV